MIGSMELAPGTLVAGWRIIRTLRAGGFGTVYQAERNGKMFAVKVAMHREESGDTGRTHRRAEREVAVLVELHHPNIIRPCGYGYLADGRVFCALEFVDGWTLGDWLERTHPTFREIARVFAQIAGAMAYMHAEGVLHRDLKLSNVMIRRSNSEPVIIDLGCATYEKASELTTTPLPPGTERYRTPQARAFLRKHGRKPGARYPFPVADELFAVGVMLYELLTDPLPTKENPRPDFADPLSSRLSAREANPRVPEALSALVEDLLAHDPTQRPEGFEALRRRLAELASHLGAEYTAEAHPPSAQRQPDPGRPAAGLAAPEQRAWRKPLVIAGLVAALVLAASAAAWRARGERPAPPLPRAPAILGPVAVPAPVPDSASTAPATAPEEGFTVKPALPDAPKSPRTARTSKAALAPTDPGFPAWCKTLPVAAALVHGCASAPLKAEPFECPPGAIEAMEKLGWDIGGEHFDLTIDERAGSTGIYGLTVGAPVTGVVDERFGQDHAPTGTLFHGRIYVTDKTADEPLGYVVAVYDHVELPRKGKFPVCVVSEAIPIRELKDNTATAQVDVAVYPVKRWKP